LADAYEKVVPWYIRLLEEKSSEMKAERIIAEQQGIGG
jgi:hypothetical protein